MNAQHHAARQLAAVILRNAHQIPEADLYEAYDALSFFLSGDSQQHARALAETVKDSMQLQRDLAAAISKLES